MLVLGDPLANGRTSHLLPALLSLLFARFCPLFSSLPASPFVFFSHPSRGRLSRGLARPITGCPPIHLFLPFSLFFFLSFFLFSPSLVSEPLSRFLRGSRSRPPRFPLSRQKGKREYSRILNFIRIHGTARISFQQFLKRIVSPFDFRQRVWFFRRLFDGRKFLVGSETLGI